jgi:hypothetical protein
MKKLLLSFILLSSLFSVDAAFADPETVIVTGTRPAAGGGSAVAGGSQTSDSGPGASGQVAGEEEGQRQAEKAKDAYCALNPTNPFCIARAKDKACKAGMALTQQATDRNSSCTDTASFNFNSDKNICAGSTQKTATNGITWSGGGSLARSTVTVSGISQADCLKIAQDTYNTKSTSCNNTYINDLAAAKPLTDQCPK